MDSNRVNPAGETGEEPNEWQQAEWPRWVHTPIRFYDNVDSTNSVAFQLAQQENAPEGTLIVAEGQREGRGKKQRKWYSKTERSISTSILLRPSFEASYVQIPTLVAAASVAASIQHLYRLPAQVKWPNDIQLFDRKVGGVLTESRLKGERIDFLIVGIGINCNLRKREWPRELRQKATSICEHLGHPVDRIELLNQILKIFGKDYEKCQAGRFSEALRGWRSLNVTVDRLVEVLCGDRSIRGIAEQLLDNGGLLIRSVDGEKPVEIKMGEIQ